MVSIAKAACMMIMVLTGKEPKVLANRKMNMNKLKSQQNSWSNSIFQRLILYLKHRFNNKPLGYPNLLRQVCTFRVFRVTSSI